MPLEGQNFKHNNKLVYKLLKAAYVDTDAWARIQKNDPSADGRKAWLALVAHYDSYGELNKRVQRAKMELSRLHYKDERFEKYVTKLKEQFRVLKMHRHASYSGLRQVETLLSGMNTTDAGIDAAKTTVFHSMQHDFDRACEFIMSAYISSKHAEAQHAYANHPVAGGPGSVAISARPGPTLTVVVAVEVAAQANDVVAPPGVAEPMVVHAHILITSTSPTPTATLQPRNGKSSAQCAV